MFGEASTVKGAGSTDGAPLAGRVRRVRRADYRDGVFGEIRHARCELSMSGAYDRQTDDRLGALDDLHILLATHAGKSSRDRRSIGPAQRHAALPPDQVGPAQSKLSLVQFPRIHEFLEPAGRVTGLPDLGDLARCDAEAPSTACLVLAKNASVRVNNADECVIEDVVAAQGATLGVDYPGLMRR